MPKGVPRIGWKQYMQNRRDSNPRREIAETVRKYGVTVEWYEEKLVEQNGLCAICKKPEIARRNGILKRLAVDHNHETGEARALLCSGCNMKIGVLENKKWLETAKDYRNKFGLLMELADMPPSKRGATASRFESGVGHQVMDLSRVSPGRKSPLSKLPR
jgi:Recombination endonuclease VII